VVRGLKGPGGRYIAAGLIVILGILATAALPVMATDYFLARVWGEYYLPLRAGEVFLEYSGTQGTIGIETDSPKYKDSFLMESEGGFSGWQHAEVSALSRDALFSGDGFISTRTEFDSTTHEFFLAANNGGSVQETFNFAGAVDIEALSMQIALDARYTLLTGWYEGNPARIQDLIDNYGLSKPEATSLVTGDLYGFISQLSQFGYSADEVIRLARSRGIGYLRDLLSALSTPHPGKGPIDKAVEKFTISRGTAKKLFAEFGTDIFVSSLSRSVNYEDFVANLEGWDIRLHTSGSLFNRLGVSSGEQIVAAFALFHPVTGRQLFDPQLVPHLNIAQVLPDGRVNTLAGYYSYIEFQMDPESGVYFAPIETAVDENTRLEPGEYRAFVVFQNPGNDTYSSYVADFEVT